MTSLAEKQAKIHSEHRHPEVAQGDCWECRGQMSKCRAKRRLMSHETANEVAHDENVRSEWRLMLVTYVCPWCGSYHLTKAKPGTARWKRAEKRRREWAAKREAKRRPIDTSPEKLAARRREAFAVMLGAAQ